MKAIIGATGIIGSSLQKRWNADVVIHQENLEGLKGRQFDHVICAAPWGRQREGITAERYDESVERLIGILTEVKAYRFTLVTCGDVLPGAGKHGEDAVRNEEGLDAIAASRARLEDFVVSRFGRVLLARLPMVFAPGIVPEPVAKLHRGEALPAGQEFQLYPVYRLYGDLTQAWELGLDALNLAAEPLTSEDLVENIFPEGKLEAGAERGKLAPPSLLVSRHSLCWHNPDGWLWTKQEILDDLAAFVARQGW